MTPSTEIEDTRSAAQLAVALENAVEGLNYLRCKALIAKLRARIAADDLDRIRLQSIVQESAKAWATPLLG